jgi:hypothetical protein
MPTLDVFIGGATAPAIADIPIRITRGDDVVIVIRFHDCTTNGYADFTGWNFTSKVKADYGGALWTTASVITHNGTGGTVTILFPKAETALLVPDEVGVWDLQGQDTGSLVRTIAGGTATVKADVT